MSVKSLLTLASISQPDASGHMKPSEAVAVKTPEPQFSFNVGNVENNQVSNTSVCVFGSCRVFDQLRCIHLCLPIPCLSGVNSHSQSLWASRAQTDMVLSSGAALR